MTPSSRSSLNEQVQKETNGFFPRVCGGAAARSAAPCAASRAVSRAAWRIPCSGTPCGPDAACDPSGSGRSHISVGLRALVNIIGRWCVKLTVPVRTPRATSPIKLSRDPLYSASTIHRSNMFDGGGAVTGFHNCRRRLKKHVHANKYSFYTMIHETYRLFWEPFCKAGNAFEHIQHVSIDRLCMREQQMGHNARFIMHAVITQQTLWR